VAAKAGDCPVTREFEKLYFQFYIGALLLLKPAALFHRINLLPWYQGTLRNWADQLEYCSGDSILEAGCATGLLSGYMAGKGALVHGIDKSPGMLQKARDGNINGALFIQTSALDLPFENDRFDFVIAASLLNIVPAPDKLIKEMARVCKPGGKVSVLVPQTDITDHAIDGLSDALKLTGFSRAALLTWHRRAPKMQRDQVLEQLDQAGLRNVTGKVFLDGMVMKATGTK
jgi:ubiquinone/menaquinone biosynthesis C-methylase UbiE